MNVITKKWSLVALLALCALVLIAFVLFACRPRPKALPAFGVDVNQTSVSGVSSGAFMAVQFEVAHSAIIKGAGIIAGGPYYCAQDDIFRALSVCTCINAPQPCNPVPGATDVSLLAKKTEDYAGSGRIDPVSRLSNHRVFLFSGMKDSIVPQAVMNDLEIYYRVFLPAGNIRSRKDVPAQHGLTPGSSLSFTHTPKIPR